jgi:hypothetical protein
MLTRVQNWFRRFRNWRRTMDEFVDLWVDDVRPAPPGWYWATTFDEAQDVLINFCVREASFDHDLGEDKSGYDLVVWLAETDHILGMDFWPERRPTVHSQNPVGRQKMIMAIDHDGPYNDEEE